MAKKSTVVLTIDHNMSALVVSVLLKTALLCGLSVAFKKPSPFPASVLLSGVPSLVSGAHVGLTAGRLPELREKNHNSRRPELTNFNSHQQENDGPSVAGGHTLMGLGGESSQVSCSVIFAISAASKTGQLLSSDPGASYGSLD